MPRWREQAIPPLEVTISLHGELRARHPGRRQGEMVVAPDGATVADVLGQLGHAHEAWLVSVNGQVARREQLLAAGDQLDLYPFMEGG